jgi:hypothetical protein
MRALNIFSLLTILAAPFVSSLFFSVAIASPMKVHVLDNLSASESKIALKALSRLGYEPTMTPLFSESTHAVVITKVLNDQLKAESFSFEVLEMKRNEALPKTLFELKSNETNIESMLKKAPTPTRVMSESPMPVAALK